MNYGNYGYYPQPQTGYNYGAQAAQQNNERIWVQGEDAAKAYLIAPNGFARLWDSTAPVFYEKSADATGRPYIETFEYCRRETRQPAAANEWQQELAAVKNKLAELESYVKGGLSNVAESNTDD